MTLRKDVVFVDKSVVGTDTIIALGQGVVFNILLSQSLCDYDDF
jgi:hypothetical protein